MLTDLERGPAELVDVGALAGAGLPQEEDDGAGVVQDLLHGGHVPAAAPGEL
jgi:hypothetical protein